MSFQNIPLSALVASDANVRRTDAKIDIDALAASIQAHGLLQNLTVKPRDERRFEVVAGGRRHAALKRLAKAGAIARDYPVPCNILEGDNAEETSLAENVQRVAMNAMDEADAFQALVDQNLGLSEIARRFGASERHVEQRLALATLSPRVKAAYRRGNLSLDAARAFCIADDHSRQDEVLKALGKPITHASQVRAMLTQGAMRADDRIARFVGLEAYEAAGGALHRDLFDADAVFVADLSLMARLANERLETQAKTYLDAGWGWTETSLTHASPANIVRRIDPTRRALTRSERKALAKCDADIEAIDTLLESEEDNDALAEERNQLEAARQAIMDATIAWPSDQMPHAGVSLCVDYNGRLAVNAGLVRKTDLAALKAVLPREAAHENVDASEGDSEAAPERKLSKALTRELTEARGAALRLAVSRRPDLGLALAVYALAHAVRSTSPLALSIEARGVLDSEDGVFANARSSFASALPEDELNLLRWCLARGQQELLRHLALLVAATMDVAHDGASAKDIALQTAADLVATAAELDMSAYWRPDLSFWSRLSKAHLIELAPEAPSIANLSEARRGVQLKAFAKMKRDDLAKKLGRAFAKTNWLPEILLTPLPAGAMVLTQDGEEAAAIAAE